MYGVCVTDCWMYDVERCLMYHAACEVEFQPFSRWYSQLTFLHRMVMENRPVDPGSIQGSHRPVSFIRIKQSTRERFFVQLSISNHIVGLVHKSHIVRTCLRYHAACKVEFQPFNRSYSQLTFSIFKNVLSQTL